MVYIGTCGIVEEEMPQTSLPGRRLYFVGCAENVNSRPLDKLPLEWRKCLP